MAEGGGGGRLAKVLSEVVRGDGVVPQDAERPIAEPTKKAADAARLMAVVHG